MKVRIPQGPSRAELMQKVQQMQEDAANLQEELDKKEYSASAGGGLINVTVTGAHEIKSIQVDPECLEDAEMLEDLLIVALNEPISTAKKTSESEMEKLQSGLELPNIPGLF